jgi:hypothetical protein
MSIPAYLVPLTALTSPVEITGPVREKKDQDDVQKRSQAFDNRLGWIVPVEIVRGTRQKRLPTGEVMDVLDTQALNVSVWTNARPTAQPGDYVSLVSPMIGSVEGNIFVQALGVEAVEEDDSLTALMGGGDDE